MVRKVSGNAKQLVTIRLDRDTLDYLDSLGGDRSANIRSAIEQHRTKTERTSYSKLLRQLKQS